MVAAIWREMWGNGVMTGMTLLIIAVAHQKTIRRDLLLAHLEFCGAAPGTAVSSSCAARAGSDTIRTAATTALPDLELFISL